MRGVYLVRTPPIIKPKNTDPLEKVSEARLTKGIKLAGGISWKFVSTSNRGVSDRVVLFYGRVIFVEMKRKGRDLTPKQRKFRQFVIDNCGEFATVVGHDGVDLFIQELLNSAPWYRRLLLKFRSSDRMINGKYGK